MVQIQIQIAINLIIMSKEFLHMRRSKSQEFWLPVTDYPRALTYKRTGLLDRPGKAWSQHGGVTVI